MKALVRHHIEAGFNRGDWTVCETTLADDYTARYGAEGKANVGRDHYVMVCKMLRKSFPDVAITIVASSTTRSSMVIATSGKERRRKRQTRT